MMNFITHQVINNVNIFINDINDAVRQNKQVIGDNNNGRRPEIAEESALSRNQGSDLT